MSSSPPSTRPAHHANSTATLFRNPWEQTATPTEWSIPSLPKFPLEWAKEHPDHPHKPVKVIKPNFGSRSNGLKATWLGHASFLLELCRGHEDDKVTRILFDPIFSDRAGPSAWTGVRRRLPPPCKIEELPEFEFVVLSHNHYDHADLPSIVSIMEMRGRDVHFLVPLGIKAWLIAAGIPSDQVSELDWWQEASLPTSRSKPDLQVAATHQVKFVCAPAQHTSGRGLMDKQATLWASWIVEQVTSSPDGRRVVAYHAGDTGYMTSQGPCPIFKEIGEKYGPIDLAMLPIWRGGSLSFIARMGLRLTELPMLSSLHATPADALAIHLAIRSRHSLAMHFATFAGSDIEAFEPIVELTFEREKLKVGEWHEEGGFGVIDVGETVEIPALGIPQDYAVLNPY